MDLGIVGAIMIIESLRGASDMSKVNKKELGSYFKMSDDELQMYIATMSKGGTHKKKKGAGSYTRKQKHKNREI